MAALAPWQIASHPALMMNVSASAPLGLYRFSEGPIGRGDWVAAWAPQWARRIAAARHYLPYGVPLIKRVVATVGANVCASETLVRLDGRALASRLPADRAGRPLPHWTGCRRLAVGEYLLINAAQASFDSRYFGPVRASSIIGKVTPL
ncbi:MAG: S26 family signal peptidase [Sphingomonadaceae bacterium]|nr:S26 family signal peptidase [Sphingomonadaceae bacterium]